MSRGHCGPNTRKPERITSTSHSQVSCSVARHAIRVRPPPLEPALGRIDLGSSIAKNESFSLPLWERWINSCEVIETDEGSVCGEPYWCHSCVDLSSTREEGRSEHQIHPVPVERATLLLRPPARTRLGSERAGQLRRDSRHRIRRRRRRARRPLLRRQGTSLVRRPVIICLLLEAPKSQERAVMSTLLTWQTTLSAVTEIFLA